MKILTIGAWANVSVVDVENGYVDALRAAGHDVYVYSLCSRIDDAARDLDRRWRRSAKLLGYPKPNATDQSYYASIPLIERYLWHKPDWVIAVSGKLLHPQVVVWLRQIGAKVGVILTESPYETEGGESSFVPYVNIAWTNERSVVPFLRHFNPHTYYLPHAYDPEKHKPESDGADSEVPAHDVVFVGTGFKERQDILEGVDWTGIDLGLYGSWPLMGSRNKLRQYVRGGIIDNKGAAALYRRAKIGLNLYRTSKQLAPEGGRIEGAESLNPRALELAACGVFQISDYRQEVEEVFGSSVSTFRRPEALGGIIRAYLKHPELRASHAKTARERVSGQTFGARVEQILADLARYEEEACRPRLALSTSS